MRNVSGSPLRTVLLPQKVAVAFLAPATIVCLFALILPGYVREGVWHTVFVVLTCVLALAIPVVLWTPTLPLPLLVLAVVAANALIIGLELSVTDLRTSSGFALFALPTMFVALFGDRRVFLALQAPLAVVGVVLSFVLAGDRGGTLVIHSTVVLSAVLSPAVALLVLRHRLDEALRRERDLAGTDPLTGLANRRGLAHGAPLVAGHAQRLGVDLCVLALDLDHFKKVNDAHGHRAGDEVLRRVAATLTASTRSLDVVARTGGEEFVVLAAMSPDDAHSLAERLREQVALECLDLGVTASLGVASAGTPARGADIDHQLWSLVDRADDFMYVAKRMGRNRVVAAPLPGTLRAEPIDAP